jgi:hypothetical protein
VLEVYDYDSSHNGYYTKILKGTGVFEHCTENTYFKISKGRWFNHYERFSKEEIEKQKNILRQQAEEEFQSFNITIADAIKGCKNMHILEKELVEYLLIQNMQKILAEKMQG